MKRAVLIAGGTIGGLAGVLAINPPQFGSSTTVAGGIPSTTNSSSGTVTATGNSAGQDTNATANATATSTATKKATAKPKATTKAKSTSQATAQATPTPAATKSATPAATKAASSGVSGTFTGGVAQTRFGNVQVQITVSNGKITSAKALQAPNRDFRSQSISQQAIPYLIEETLAANGSNIQGVGGASYTSQGWYDSLVSALSQAGMK